MITAKLTYQAKSAEEFKSLVNWMTGEETKSVSARVAPPAGANFVEQYLAAKGEQRFRLSDDEREEFGENREAAAEARLDALGLIEAEEAPEPADDGEDTFG